MEAKARFQGASPTAGSSCLFNFCVVVLALTATSLATAEESRGALEVEARNVELDQGEGVALFTGGVVIRREGLELRCDRMTARMGEQGRLLAVEASGNVRFISSSVRATAASAFYNLETNQLTLSGGPVLTSESGELRGRVIVVDLDSHQVSIEQARGTFRFN